MTMSKCLLFLPILLNAIPNPTSNGFKECGLTAPSTLCDTDGIFTTADRHHLDHELKMFETRTRRARPWNIHAAREKMTCDDKGITPSIAVVRRGNAGEVDAIIEDMKANWTLDSVCNNTVFIVFSAEETQFSVSRPTNISRSSPLQAYDVAHFLRRQARQFQSGNYGTAFLSILQQTWERAVTRYTRWNVTHYPNPMMGEHRLIDLRNDASIFEYLTTNMYPFNTSSNVSSFCQSRGYTAGIAIMRNVEGGTKDAIQSLARNLLKEWRLDERCKKALIIALAVDDRIFSVVKAENVDIDIESFTKFFDAESENFHQSEIKSALANIMKRAVQRMIESSGAMSETTTETNEIEATDGPKVPRDTIERLLNGEESNGTMIDKENHSNSTISI
ncbi:hypothetical protein PRIPAC_76771 [Pristionchus pacificus]|uniref:Uncharacterized protein n=1 Tax=Pristionchus pacificus TaxID=54126 RepID=A0A2A6BE31_PRIPA|nr:hypothetical protein PRIPAC_76771 [Pristionchus pacificus]|eukprot:PDM64155.1 hypothetical protein PRIPAC_54399 [Pristionchus pacificus]